MIRASQTNDTNLAERASVSFEKVVDSSLRSFEAERAQSLTRISRAAEMVLSENSDPSIELNQLQNELFQFAWNELKKDSSEITLEQQQQQSTKVNNFMDTADSTMHQDPRNNEMVQALSEKYEKLMVDYSKI
mmetsp:Transcript_32856/g.29724  ORF Transcript_32856/g.29724 Transcript_32856/m.29724 type:complete len:133 (-) Transcript_32856:427-825(-)